MALPPPGSVLLFLREALTGGYQCDRESEAECTLISQEAGAGFDQRSKVMHAQQEASGTGGEDRMGSNEVQDVEVGDMR